jgi:Carboxypeptidase regulatory-like domain/TonB-dependent Receptor Plug Domain
MKIKMGQLVVVGFVLFLSALISLPLQAQVAGATLSGTITDAQGGAVPNAKVSAKNLATAVVSESTTNGAGLYTIPNLNPGDYEVTVSSAGFSTTATKLSLTVGAKQELNLSLMVGQVLQTVEVTGAAPQVELESSTIAGNVNSNTVRELPLNGRDWASLATLEPSVVEARTHLDVTHVGGGGGRGFGDQLSVSGGRPTQNSYRLDGILVNDYSNAGPGSVLGKNLGVDAIQEFTVLTSNYSAEYGFTSGGVINAITKSGTNSFHGTAFDFVRNDAFDAANFFNNANGLGKNELRQNQFGAAGGYKILADKLFLFGDYEGVRRVAGLAITNCGATPCETIADAVRNGTVTNLTTGAVTQVAIDPSIAKLLALYPHPTPGVACVTVTVTGPLKGQCNPNVGAAPFSGFQKAREDFFTARADYKLSDKDSLLATYLRDPSSFTSPLSFNNELQLFTSYRQAIVAEETHVFSPSLANSFRVGLDRTTNLGGNSPTVLNPAAGDPSLGMLPGYFSPQVTLTGTGVTTLPGGQNGGASIQDFWGAIYQLYDDAFWTKGKHGFKFGFSALGYQVNGYTPLQGYNGNGTFTFAGIEAVAGGSTSVATAAEQGSNCLKSGNPASGNNYDTSCGTLVNFLADQPRNAARPFDATQVNKHYLRDKIFSAYFQDDWHLRPSLTVNLGLRYEVATIPKEIHGEVLVMPSPSTILPCGPAIAGSCPQPSVQLAGLTSPTGDPTSVLRNSFWSHNPTLKDFEPRIGFAWDPFHNGKTAVRGGFGVFDALPLPYELILNNTSAAPWRSTLSGTTFGSNTVASPPKGAWPFQIPALLSANLAAVGLPNGVVNPINRSFQYIDNNIKRNYVFQYNLNVQRQITPSTTILIGYNGSRGYHNPFQADSVNTVIPTLVPNVGYVWPTPWSGSLTATQQAARLLNPSTDAIEYDTMYQSRSWYNALQIRVDKRLSHGFQVQGSFTWSKSMDDSSGSTAGDTFQLDAVSEPWYDLRLDKGLSDFNVGRNLTINGLYNVPTPKSLGGIGEKALGGWEFGLIVSLGDGVPMPLNIASAASLDLAGEIIPTVQPPNLVPGCSAQSLANSSSAYRSNGLLYINSNCLSLTPLTATNAPFCDSAGRGFALALAATTCPSIRGNFGRDVIIGPGLFDTNFSVFKNNYIRKVSESFNVQFRAEFFNVLNRTNFAPTPNLSPFNSDGTPTQGFGQLGATQINNREIQLALKVIW